MPIVLFDEAYWREVVHFEKLVEFGVIDAADLTLFRFADSAEGTWEALVEQGLHITKPGGASARGKDI